MKRFVSATAICATVWLAANGCGVSDVIVEVNGQPDTLTITIVDANSVIVEGLALEVGDTAALGATALNALGQSVGDITATWSSTTPTVATVNRDTGRVIARGAGTTTVSAFYEGVTATIEVSVTNPSAPPGPPSNVPPVARIQAPSRDTTVNLGNTICFLGAPSDSDGVIVTHDWRFGDGNSSGVEDPCSHRYAAAGSYTVRYSVTDDQGASHSVTRRVNVESLTGPPPPPPPPSSGELLIASDWSSGEWSDGGKWGNASHWTQNGRAFVVPAEAGEPWAQKLRVANINQQSFDSWVQMAIDGGPAPALGQPVTIRWYERITGHAASDPGHHGIALGDNNGNQPWYEHHTGQNQYWPAVQVLGDFDDPYAPQTKRLNMREWYRVEWTITQETASQARMAINIYDMSNNVVMNSNDFTDWQWNNGQTSLAQRVFAGDLRALQTKFTGFLDGMDAGPTTWGDFAAVAMVLGTSVGPYDPARGY